MAWLSACYSDQEACPTCVRGVRKEEHDPAMVVQSVNRRTTFPITIPAASVGSFLPLEAVDPSPSFANAYAEGDLVSVIISSDGFYHLLGHILGQPELPTKLSSGLFPAPLLT